MIWPIDFVMRDQAITGRKVTTQVMRTNRSTILLDRFIRLTINRPANQLRRLHDAARSIRGGGITVQTVDELVSYSLTG